LTSRSIQSETLDLLEWQRLCQQVSTFAATKLGYRAAQTLLIPDRLEQSLDLLNQTREIYHLETIAGKGLTFEGIEDIGSALERASRGGILSGEELLNIAGTLAGARNLRRVIDAQPEEELPTLSSLVSTLRTYPELERHIHHCIDDRGRVTDRASEKLAGIREQWKNQREFIYQKLQRILQRQSNALQEAVITQRQGRFVVPVKAPQKDAIPGLVHDSSGSGATLYIEPHNIVEANNRLRQLSRQEEAEEERVRQGLSEQVAEVVTDLELLLAIVTTLDLAAARARYSYWLGGNPPRFIAPVQGSSPAELSQSPSEAIVLRQLRHPLLLWQERQESGSAVVPIDLIIKPEIRVVAITGPNTGGKTVTLKTLGLVCLMAKAGLFVPAKEPVELPWFEHILADIGDEQSLQQSLSTFSGHIKRISRILAVLAPGDCLSPSLVLLDEVGAGTDPSEGSALARSLLQYLADHSQLTIATTHFGELKALKYQDPRFENASVEFDDQSLSPTYRLLWGIPGRSNALTIALRLGLVSPIVEQAQTYVTGESSTDVNSVIAQLEQQRREQEDKASSAAKLLRQTEHLYRELNRKAEQLKQREWDLKQQQEVVVQEAIQQAKSDIAEVIRKLQRGPQLAQRAKTATEAIDRIAATHLPSQQVKATPETTPKAPPTFKPQIGDRVRVPRFNQVADVISEVDGNGEITVRLGLMKMSLGITEIESLKGEKVEELPKKPPRDHKPQDSKPQEPDPEIRTSRNTLDLRGSRVADAEIEIDRSLAEATGPIWIIHGHGTGKLRRGVHEFLKQHPQVQSFEAAAQSDGGTGVTLVRVKL
jgi:DNA mismatch repair protein MutS2